MGFFTPKSKNIFPWKKLNSEEEVIDAFESSVDKPALFFKHSTRCSISAMALSRLQEKWTSGEQLYDLYFIDLIKNRQVSNLLEEISGVKHESPQVIVVFNKEVIYSASHSSIDTRTIEKLIQ